MNRLETQVNTAEITFKKKQVYLKINCTCSKLRYIVLCKYD